MRKLMTIVLIVCGVIAVPYIVLVIHDTWVVLPTASSPNTLTLVGDSYINPNPITVRHYVNDMHINDYVLELTSGIQSEHPQRYMLPELDAGWVEISVGLYNEPLPEENRTVTVNYVQASDLYGKGLLIRATTDYGSSTYIDNTVYRDEYIYFVSGKDRTYFIRKAGSSEWLLTNTAPQLEGVSRRAWGYFPSLYNWKEENKWVVLPAKTE